jgi:hypothetical protein
MVLMGINRIVVDEGPIDAKRLSDTSSQQETPYSQLLPDAAKSVARFMAEHSTFGGPS